MRICTQTRFQHLDLTLVRSKQPGNRAFGVIHIADDARATDAAFDTGGQQASLKPVLAEGALVGGLCLVVDEARVVGASLNAVTATDASRVVDEYDAVGALKSRLNRANGDAGRVVAVVAQPRQADHRRRHRAVLEIHFVLQYRRSELPDRRQILD